MTESFCMLLLQSYILANAWGAYPTVPLGRIMNIGKAGLLGNLIEYFIVNYYGLISMTDER